jgi:Fe2+ transport system protein FeoA
MPDKKPIPLSKLEAGQSGRVVEIHGGHGVVNRLNALNIRYGQRVTKVSSMFMRGPVTIEVGNGSRVAIGYGMAKRILVE